MTSALPRGLLLAGTAGLLVPIGGSPTQAQGAGAADQEITDWIVIAPDGEVTLGLSQPEVGQGSCTVLPQILADELDADWQRVKVRFVTGRDAYKIAFKNEPPVQKEGASMSNTVLYSRLRTAGAQAREVLIRATAGHWNVTPVQCRADRGFVVGPQGRNVPVRSCSLPVSEVGDGAVTTIEGIAGREAMAVQRAWIAGDVPQCGYCQPGQIMGAIALLKANKRPTDRDIDLAMSGNLCHCATYVRIREAIHAAARDLEGPR